MNRFEQITRLKSQRLDAVIKHKGRKALDCKLRAKVVRQLKAEMKAERRVS